MKSLYIASLMLMVAVVSVSPAQESGSLLPKKNEKLGITQGEFCLHLMKASAAERFIHHGITSLAAADQLTKLGFSPADGWKIDEDLTWDHIYAAYSRLLQVMDILPKSAVADLSVRCKVTPGATDPDSEVSCLVNIANRGPDRVSGVNLNIDIDGQLKARGTKQDTIVINSLEPGSSRNIELAYLSKGEPGTKSSVIPSVDTGPVVDYNTDNNRTSAGVIIHGGDVKIADLEVRVMPSEIMPRAGKTMNMTVLVANLGPDEATGIVVSNTLPAGLLFKKSDSRDFHNGLWEIDSIPKGTVKRLNILTEAGLQTETWIMTNRAAVISMNQADPTDGNNSDKARMAVKLVENLSQVVKLALKPASTERQPVSPDRPLRR
jgi:uncharacterized repeat protein (TIGR01451 family)